MGVRPLFILIREQFEAEATEAVILVDASKSNAFDVLVIEVLLQNIQILIPEFSKFAINIYRCPCKLLWLKKLS